MAGQSNIFQVPQQPDPMGNPTYATDGTFSTEKRNFSQMDALKKKSQATWEATINAAHNKLK